DDNDAGGDAPRRVGRHEADAERRGGGNENRGEKDAAPAELVAEASEHEAADRPREVADGERGERRHERDERILAGEEGAADLRREDAEDDEVVVLERAAEAGEENHAPGAAGHPTCPEPGRGMGHAAHSPIRSGWRT